VHVLLVSPRLPLEGGKGDQLRAFQFLQTISRSHTVEVVTTGAGVGGAVDRALPSRVAIRARRQSLPVRALGALEALFRGQPAQVGWMMPAGAWREVRRRAADADVVLAITVRSVRGRLPAPLVLDHVDALSVNMRRRANGDESAPVRWAARLEAAFLERWERRLSRAAAAQIAISALDASLLPTPPEVHVVPNFVEMSPVGPESDGARDIDAIFTGSMSYPPNADAARWLSEEIAPALWARRPEASIWVVGRDADRLAVDPRIELRADVPDLGEYLRRAKVGLAPLRTGTGSPNKVLEAMAAGAAVVATPAAVEPFGFPETAVETAASADALAAATERLLADPEARSVQVERARTSVRDYGPEAQRERLETILGAAARRPLAIPGARQA
jgi:glycosyltransferase involved in cell wall biosynthesis